MESDDSARVWLITGASSGFGAAMARAALAAGERVVAVDNRPEGLAELTAEGGDRALATVFDVTDTDRAAEVVSGAVQRFGRIDVLVNNAGVALFGAVEETTDAQLRGLMNVHVFGPAALVRAALPHLRARGSGAVVQMSSYLGRLSFAGAGAYSAVKGAVEGLLEALAQEVAPFGVRVLIVQPGAFRTGFNGVRQRLTDPLPAYAETLGGVRELAASLDGTQPGDPAKAAAAIRAALAAENPPLRLALGNDAVEMLTRHADRDRAELSAWEAVSRGTDLDRLA